MNNQIPTPQDLTLDGVHNNLKINSIFYTIQGEGPFSGTPAVFLRLADCCLQCSWCDTDYSHSFELDLPEIITKIEETKEGFKGLIVITGGEPFNQNLSYLCNRLYDSGFSVQIETNGTLTQPKAFPWEKVTIVVSPKTKFVHLDIERNMAAVKYVISSDDIKSETGTPLYSTQVNCGGGQPKFLECFPEQVYLSPLDSKDEEQNWENKQTVAKLCLKFGYNVSLQVHKILDLQ